MLTFKEFQENRHAQNPGEYSIHDLSVMDFVYPDGTDQINLISMITDVMVTGRNCAMFVWTGAHEFSKGRWRCVSLEAAERHLYDEYYVPFNRNKKANEIMKLDKEYGEYLKKHKLPDMSAEELHYELQVHLRFVTDFTERYEKVTS